MDGNDEYLRLPSIVEKLASKHGVMPNEVEEVFENEPREYFRHKGNLPGEDVYVALGQTDVGRYLFIVFIEKLDERLLILSARDMEKQERRRYERK